MHTVERGKQMTNWICCDQWLGSNLVSFLTDVLWLLEWYLWKFLNLACIELNSKYYYSAVILGTNGKHYVSVFTFAREFRNFIWGSRLSDWNGHTPERLSDARLREMNWFARKWRNMKCIPSSPNTTRPLVSNTFCTHEIWSCSTDTDLFPESNALCFFV